MSSQDESIIIVDMLRNYIDIRYKIFQNHSFNTNAVIIGMLKNKHVDRLYFL